MKEPTKEDVINAHWGWWDDVKFYSFQGNGPLLWPVFNLFHQFMNIERGDKFPFYTFPYVKKWINTENLLGDFLSNLLDAHEDERNNSAAKRHEYFRFTFNYDNWFRLQNDTFANLHFQTKAP